MNTVGEYLKSIREKKGLSLKEVYRKTGISDSKLSRIEKEPNPFEITLSVLKALTELYGIDLIELLVHIGYLDEKALSSYKRVFQNVDLLSNKQKKHIQEEIDLFIKERKNT